ncbi:MAG: polysaccharide biosynthesis/export family protein, partial [Candidatus Omnitrophica bacterium]|nr:polysaccharide biosynthesis/export family protein [Candidatus Omnitrophota bacterium]
MRKIIVQRAVFALQLLLVLSVFKLGYAVESSQDYIISSEDVLDINVWKDEDLTKVVSVDTDGSITLPYINKVKVSGLSCKEAANLIAERLKSGNFLIDPKVTVSVKEYRGQKIMVFGLVKVEINPEVKSGKMTVTRKDAAGEKVIEVDLASLVLRGDLGQNIEILPGDSIVISAKDPLPEQASDSDYVIAAVDVLDINVWKDEDLTKVVSVDTDGSITLPYINKVRVSGLSCKEAANLIAERLKSGNFLIDPKVTVSVKEYRGQKIMVFGLV